MSATNPITAVEQALLDQVSRLFGNTLHEVASIGGGWTADSLRRALQFAPGVYVAFQGGAATVDMPGALDGRFVLYVVTKGAIETDRRRGTPVAIGAYELVARLVAGLDGMTFAGIGGLRVVNVANLFQDALFDIGGTVYAVECSVPKLMFDSMAPLDDTLGDFITFDARYDIDNAQTDNPVAHDTVTLPQP